MNRIGKQVIVLGACLALVLAWAQALGAKWIPGTHTGNVTYLYDLERAIYRFTNEARQKNGLATLTWENSLRDVARAHSADMLVRNYFSHNTPEGRSPHERIREGCRIPLSMSGENIWTGTGYQSRDPRTLARTIVDNWMSSPGHRTNLLHPELTDIGVGVAANGKEVRVTQVFIRHLQRR